METEQKKQIIKNINIILESLDEQEVQEILDFLVGFVDF